MLTYLFGLVSVVVGITFWTATDMGLNCWVQSNEVFMVKPAKLYQVRLAFEDHLGFARKPR
ncbi:hypothetical protein [Blastomonas sp.]|uniref:hypothetical protein n=1 Tax=Blastomonas sp. TaxID=1909299 RepID=UPI00391AF56B